MVHPHSRGDNHVLHAHDKIAYGTPPLAWGQPHSINFERSSYRYTPTRVGTTSGVV